MPKTTISKQQIKRSIRILKDGLPKQDLIMECFHLLHDAFEGEIFFKHPSDHMSIGHWIGEYASVTNKCDCIICVRDQDLYDRIVKEFS